jgi:hypothetical protein
MSIPEWKNLGDYTHKLYLHDYIKRQLDLIERERIIFIHQLEISSN